MLDFIYSGIAITSEVIHKTEIYKNNGDNTFSAQDNIVLAKITEGDTEWGDYNNDGYLDIVLLGRGETKVTKIYKNNGNETFTELTGNSLIGVSWGVCTWGDFDNDGFLDLLLMGIEPLTPSSIGRIYKNIDNDIFAEQIDISIAPVFNSDAVWGDYDNDDDLDILLSGVDGPSSFITKIYKNNTPNPNIKPNPITGLQTEIIGNDVYFSWDEATDDNQPSPGLNYNIYVYSEDNQQSILAGEIAYEHQFIASPQAFIYNHPLNGKRLLSQRGHIQGIRENGRISYMLKGVFENCKIYYWSVQAIDASFAGGEFAPEASFVFDNIAPEITCPTNLTIEITQDQTQYIVTGAQLDPVSYSDNCENVTIANSFNLSETMQGAELAVGTTPVLWTVTDLGGNQTQCSFNVEVKQVVSINEVLANKITVSPNPSKGIFTIKNSTGFPISELQLSITDITGKEIMTRRHAPLDMQINISNQPKGIYFLTLSNKDFIQTTKLIIY